MAEEESNSWDTLSKENCLKLLEEPPDGKVKLALLICLRIVMMYIFIVRTYIEDLVGCTAPWQHSGWCPCRSAATHRIPNLPSIPPTLFFHLSLDDYRVDGSKERDLWSVFFVFLCLIKISPLFSRCPALDLPEMFLLNEKAALDKRCVCAHPFYHRPCHCRFPHHLSIILFLQLLHMQPRTGFFCIKH